MKIPTGMMLLASSELRPGRLLLVLQYTKTSLEKEFLAQNVNSAKAEKH